MAKIYHHNSKPVLEFQSLHGTQIIADLDTGLQMFGEDFEERRKLQKLEEMLGKKPQPKATKETKSFEELLEEEFKALLENYNPTPEIIKEKEGGMKKCK